jgi:hypothetical protein
MQETSMKADAKQTCLYAGFFLGLFFNLGDGGDMFLRNVG